LFVVSESDVLFLFLLAECSTLNAGRAADRGVTHKMRVFIDRRGTLASDVASSVFSGAGHEVCFIRLLFIYLSIYSYTINRLCLCLCLATISDIHTNIFHRSYALKAMLIQHQSSG